jgi:ACS family hexuronate transporter-like MFS transporter
LGGAVFQSLSGLAVKNISATAGYSAAYNTVFLGYGLLALIGLFIILFVMGPLIIDEKLQIITQEPVK